MEQNDIRDRLNKIIAEHPSMEGPLKDEFKELYDFQVPRDLCHSDHDLLTEQAEHLAPKLSGCFMGVMQWDPLDGKLTDRRSFYLSDNGSTRWKIVEVRNHTDTIQVLTPVI